MIPLTIITDPIGGWVALGFILFFVGKAILAAIGATIDFDADADFDADVDVNSDGFGFSSSDIFSLKGFLNFGVGFSVYWALFGIDVWYNALFAVLVGIATMFALVFVYRACMKLDSNIVLEKPNELVGRMGCVYAKNDNNLVVQLNYNNRVDELAVLPEVGTTLDDYHVGEDVFVSRVEEDSILKIYVKPFNN